MGKLLKIKLNVTMFDTYSYSILMSGAGSCFLSVQFLFAKRTARYDSEPLIHTLEVKYVGTRQLPHLFFVFIIG